MSLNLTAVRNGNGWKPGQSGNPKGAPQRYNGETLAELCKARTVEAVNTLIVMMRFKGPNQLPATLAILDRGWGRPAQRIEGDGASHLHLHLLAAQLVEAVTVEARLEPQQQAVIEGSVPTE
jgi:hypothetical protein